MTKTESTLAQFQKLIDLVATLRGPEGCPWDKSQTSQSLTYYIIEEAFELCEAIESEDVESFQDELGDFLFQVILQAQIANESQHFDLEKVLRNLNDKLIRRHPHVFSSQKDSSKNIEEVWKVWEETKRLELANKSAEKKKIFNFPKAIPALQAAHKIGKKAQTHNFDWSQVQSVIEKLDEEVSELKSALASNNSKAEIEGEIGDCLFSLAQIARHLEIDPEAALRKTNQRFIERFNLMIEFANHSVEKFVKLEDSEKQALWQRAKDKQNSKSV